VKSFAPAADNPRDSKDLHTMAELALKQKHYDLATMLPFLVLHASVLLVLVVPFEPSLLLWLVGSYYLRMFGVTAGYHRYFSHRAFKTSRFWQFCLAFLAQTSGQKGALWWAAHHRDHHLYSDRKEDLHSPVHEGFWWSHLGWILSDEYDTYHPDRIADFHKYWELRLLQRFHQLPTVIYGAAIYAIGGWPAFVWGFIVATVVLYHGTFLINSLTHIWGSRRFATPDESRNNFVLALVTLGEGWHNNHHHYMSSVRQGIRWWEIDVTFYVLVVLSWVGITRDLRPFRPAVSAESL
jgi:stearoyl-CoA desaturase (delta-9 desaturase)